MIDRSHALPVSLQARLIGIARSSAYYQPRLASDAEHRRTAYAFPFAGARMLARLLRGRTIEWANQVYALGTTSIPMARGFLSI